MQKPDITPLQIEYLEAMRCVPAAVNAVTTAGPAGRFGVTVTAMSSLSLGLSRPSLLACVNLQSPTSAAILENGVFCVNTLSEGQDDVADLLAGRSRLSHDERFNAHAWGVLETGAPSLDGAMASFDCRLISSARHESHIVFIGEIAALRYSHDRQPLMYADRRYHVLPVRASAA